VLPLCVHGVAVKTRSACVSGNGDTDGDGNGGGEGKSEGEGNGDIDGEGNGDVEGKIEGEGNGSPTCRTVLGASGFRRERMAEGTLGGGTGCGS